MAFTRLFKKFLFLTGTCFLLIAFLKIFFTLGPFLKSELSYQLKNENQTEEPKLVAPDPYFSLAIPKINAQAKIVPNVDASIPKEYLAALKKGVAHVKGTVFPGMTGTIWLFAHSTDAPWNIVRYNAIFYLLRELQPDDQIVIFFNSKRYNYRVVEAKIVKRTENSFFDQKEEEILVLQTCYPPGTTKEALLIFAKKEYKL